MEKWCVFDVFEIYITIQMMFADSVSCMIVAIVIIIINCDWDTTSEYWLLHPEKLSPDDSDLI